MSVALASPPPQDPWDGYQWPGWLPDTVQAHIEHRHPTGPADWMADAAVYPQAPVFGTDIAITHQRGGATLRGRYAHLAGPVGRLIPASSDQVVVTTMTASGPVWVRWT